MSGMRPVGEKIRFNEEERELLFTLSAIEQIQEQFQEPIDKVLYNLIESPNIDDFCTILCILLNDEAERARYFQKAEKRLYEEFEIKWLVTSNEIGEYVRAIFKAYGISLPDVEDGDYDPNLESESTKK